jgi:hypothetical protein
MADQNNVKVIEKNAGPKIAYEQTGTCLIFGDYELMINAAKYQKDWDVTVDICKDKAGNLAIGTESGLRYVAQVMIPAATYTETPIHDEETELLEESGDGMNHDNILREQNPLDMGDVTLVLWSIE